MVHTSMKDLHKEYVKAVMGSYFWFGVHYVFIIPGMSLLHIKVMKRGVFSKT